MPQAVNVAKPRALPKALNLDGVSRCTRYAVAPNRLHLCGPDETQEFLAYLHEGVSDKGLEQKLRGFTTMYPYLQTIARANRIRDPFDSRVVEAYWIGNDLLETIEPKIFYEHAKDLLKLPKRMTPKTFEQLEAKIRAGARMHHSFHVLNIYTRTGHMTVEHTLESFDHCRVGWGVITKIEGPFITVKAKPVVLIGKKLALGEPTERRVVRRLENAGYLDDLQVGDTISFHWSLACEKISDRDARRLEHYTLQSIAFSNQTL